MKTVVWLGMSIVAALTLVSSAVFAGSSSIKQRLKLQQHQTFQQNQQNTQKAVTAAHQSTGGGFETASGPEGAKLPTLEDLTDADRINAERQVEATLIYRNLRLVQKIPHPRAIEVLENAGYPTDRIVSIR